MRQSRHPKLGDMLVVTPERRTSFTNVVVTSQTRKYVGVVYEIRLDKWGHQNNVFVAWQDAPAPNYNRVHGYCGMNIHNLRSEFRVVRNGVDIP